MSEQKTCRRCARAIDTWSKICPFCNWDQSATEDPPPIIVPQAVADYKPPDDFDWKQKGAIVGAGLIVLVLAFLIGMVINSDGAPKNAPETLEEQLAEERKAGPVRKADTQLVPVNEPGGIEQAITSAPASAQPGAPGIDYQRTDATAVSAADYAEMAKRARAEKERMNAMVDPRSITAPAYRTARRASPAQTQFPGMAPDMPRGSGPIAQPARRSSFRTRPVPEYQPVPRISARGVARLSLLVGKDGRVKQVDIERPLARDTARLLRAVQSWRFKPATENGQPVAAPYSVEISFTR